MLALVRPKSHGFFVLHDLTDEFAAHDHQKYQRCLEKLVGEHPPASIDVTLQMYLSRKAKPPEGDSYFIRPGMTQVKITRCSLEQPFLSTIIKQDKRKHPPDLGQLKQVWQVSHEYDDFLGWIGGHGCPWNVARIRMSPDVNLSCLVLDSCFGANPIAFNLLDYADVVIASEDSLDGFPMYSMMKAWIHCPGPAVKQSRSAIEAIGFEGQVNTAVAINMKQWAAFNLNFEQFLNSVGFHCMRFPETRARIFNLLDSLTSTLPEASPHNLELADLAQVVQGITNELPLEYYRTSAEELLTSMNNEVILAKHIAPSHAHLCGISVSIPEVKKEINAIFDLVGES